ncbi:MAG: branched-chain amino acid ABC transporter permease [Aminobacterium sp.]|jgi:branched-chain amino acid transport system permease protein|uniref:branched-chain amino acid ABC transporter permease n=1 Tax=unclassified Aminobacterium TaxID=2685012 RepID=UPI001BCEB15B|nr:MULTISPECIES: branched-chain amino acid ABC transporter permease [unclassified Aminobacterium]MDD2207267.1 branched-chain amino acid ABC transporter permease [Aminobacterium sp.]MDD3425265.1 branched-chain amino acid ABC transporter permease [Aminobacterium sp.]MDD3707770.1 branched-chain amino acid ABC transporter permease [Aminobacterium sp.]MDD4229163.1 branched-chain amino acid ABC transporter permease [Aminobacterium sp.]MDD4552028.1 branched-chain amino acid ABC transporter permease [
MYLLIEQILNGLATGSTYALIALGLALVYGILGILHVAHAGVYMVGAYIGIGIYSLTGNIFLAMIASMVFCGFLGVAIERYIYFPLLKFPPYVPLISSIAIFTGMEELIRLIAGPTVQTYSLTLPFPTLKIKGMVISSNLMGIYIITALVFFLLWYFSTQTETGLAMRATSQDMAVASSLGINSQRIIDLSFFISSAIAALAGVLVGIYYNTVSPGMGAVPAYKALALIVVGGLGSVPGAVIASLALGIAETVLIGFAHVPLPRDALAFIAMIVVLMWKPQGLFGRKG